MVELELPHLMINCARGSPKRQEMFEKKGLFQVRGVGLCTFNYDFP